jgi:hypothetical protein
MDIKNILNGWQNFISKSEVVEKLAEDRAGHCISCVELKEGRLLVFIKDDLKEIEGCYCSICTCPISAKIRSKKETCPLKKW